MGKSDVTGMGMQTEIQKLAIMEATAATPAALGGRERPAGCFGLHVNLIGGGRLAVN